MASDESSGQGSPPDGGGPPPRVSPPPPMAATDKQPEPTAEPLFTVRVQVLDRTYAAPLPQGNPWNFWASCYRGDLPGAPKEMEDALSAKFDQSLQEQAKNFAAVRLAAPTERDAPIPFAFRINRDFQYGSLLFGVDVLGAGALLHYFGDHPELVLAFLDLCVPQAFEASLPPGTARLDFTVTPNQALRTALAGGGETPQQAAEASPATKAPWAEVIQRLVQAGWLGPILISLVVLYVAANLVSSERDRLTKREEALDAREEKARIAADAREKDMRTAYDARLQKLESLTLDLIRQLREKPASGASAASAPSGASSATVTK